MFLSLEPVGLTVAMFLGLEPCFCLGAVFLDLAIFLHGLAIEPCSYMDLQ